MPLDFETISVTLNAQPTRRQLRGRWYLVVNATILQPRVIPGSKGALYYPPTENGRYDGDHWNGMPLIVWHPKDENGNPISGRTPDVLNEYGIGDFYSTQNNNGVINGQAWFDEELTSRFDRKLPDQYKMLPRIMAGLPIELSTGLFTENELAPPGSHHDGTPYTHIARNHRPDHIAVLPDQPGACGVKDGCGINVVTNSTVETPLDKERMGLLKEMWTTVVNAVAGQPRSANSGKYKTPGSGTGKGPEQAYAQTGAMVLTDEDQQYGMLAATEVTVKGHNPVSWVEDEGTWERAKRAAAESGQGDNYAVVAHIYRQMGGKKKPMTNNSNPEGCNQHTGPGCSVGSGSLGKNLAVHLLTQFHDPHEFRSKYSSLDDAGKKAVVKDLASRDAIHPSDAKKKKPMTATEVISSVRGQLEKHKLNHSSNALNRHVKFEESDVYKRIVANSQEGIAMPTKVENIQYLTTNCSCWKDKGVMLNALPDKDVEAFRTEHEEKVAGSQVVNAIKEKFGEKFKGKTNSELVINAMPEFIKKKMKDMEDDDDDDDDTEEEETPKKKKKDMPMNNEFDPKTAVENYLKGLTIEKRLELFPEVKELVQNSAATEVEAKLDIVNKLVANVADGDKKELTESLIKLPYKTLKKMTPIANQVAQATQEFDPVQAILNQYTGMQGPPITPVVNGSQKDRPIVNGSHESQEMPTMDYDEVSDVGRLVRNYNMAKTGK